MLDPAVPPGLLLDWQVHGDSPRNCTAHSRAGSSGAEPRGDGALRAAARADSELLREAERAGRFGRRAAGAGAGGGHRPCDGLARGCGRAVRTERGAAGRGAGRPAAIFPRAQSDRARTMSMPERWTIARVRAALESRNISARELVEEFYRRIAQRNPRLNAYLALCPERAYAQADRVDRIVAQGAPLPSLAGVPVAIKDVIATRGVATTCGSRILENYRPPYDATAVERLEAAGAIVLGKTNCDEFAMGSSNENSAYGAVRNPVAEDRVPGGSSGGSAAAVAAGLAVASLGTDTGGSVRQPAAFCGITALMPTYGRVSRYGLVAFASSLDRIGPMTLTVADAAVLLQVMAGADGRDSTAAPVAVPDYAAGL